MATLHRTEVLTFPAESIQLYITDCSRLAARLKLQVSCGSFWDELGAARIPLLPQAALGCDCPAVPCVLQEEPSPHLHPHALLWACTGNGSVGMKPHPEAGLPAQVWYHWRKSPGFPLALTLAGLDAAGRSSAAACSSLGSCRDQPPVPVPNPTCRAPALEPPTSGAHCHLVPKAAPEPTSPSLHLSGAPAVTFFCGATLRQAVKHWDELNNTRQCTV